MWNSQAGCLTLFLLPFAFGVLILDAGVGYGFVRQLHSTLYSSAPGLITHSAVEEHPSSNHHFEVRYTYEVDGRTYQGERYRYGDWSSSDTDMFEELRARFPAQSSVQVFYRPGAPWDSVLVRGVQGLDLYLLLFVTPFNLAIFGGLYALWRSGRKANEGLRMSERNGRIHVRVTEMTPALAGLAAAAVACLVCASAVGSEGGLQAPLSLVALAWGVVVAVGVSVAGWRGARWGAGASHLILDPEARSLSLPPMFGRRKCLEVAWSQVQSVTLETRSGEDSEGLTRLIYRPTLVFSVEGNRRRETLAEWRDQERAVELVSWLESRVVRGGPGEKSWVAA